MQCWMSIGTWAEWNAHTMHNFGAGRFVFSFWKFCRADFDFIHKTNFFETPKTQKSNWKTNQFMFFWSVNVGPYRIRDFEEETQLSSILSFLFISSNLCSKLRIQSLFFNSMECHLSSLATSIAFCCFLRASCRGRKKKWRNKIEFHLSWGITELLLASKSWIGFSCLISSIISWFSVLLLFTHSSWLFSHSQTFGCLSKSKY